MQSINQHEEGVCPNCENNGLNYGVLVPESGAVYYPWDCPSCGASGEEWFNLEFTNHERVEVPTEEEE